MEQYVFSAVLWLVTLGAMLALAVLVRRRARERLGALEARLDRIEARLGQQPVDPRIADLSHRVRDARATRRFSPQVADKLLGYLGDLNRELREG